MKFAVEATGVTVIYEEGTKALVNVDFNVEEGQFVALFASNGAGKSTLIKAITGLLKPQAGTVRIAGKELASMDPKELYSTVGVTFQNPDDQLFAATVEEDVAFGPRNLGLGEAEVARRVEEALTDVEAIHLRKKAIHHLSFGEKKRVVLAGILAMRPSILVLDEPTAGLDPAGEAAVMLLLSNLNRLKGLTIILATHSVDMLPLLAHSICVLSHGQVVQRGTAEEIFTESGILEQVGLRLPYVTTLLHQMKAFDGLPVNDLPLTIYQARIRFLELIPQDILAKPNGAPNA
ncbi:MAG: ATP-binding cassette domain-containing protein [Nitrospinae bacterium]|nr:ATP-binding cassette domain-containing protein [Nitrospinota bacterium]